MFNKVHVDNNNLPLCGAAGFDKELLVNKTQFTNHTTDEYSRCWECGSIIGIDTMSESNEVA